MKTILIVDDDPMVLESTKTYLELKGFNTICAQDGDEALKKVETANVDLALIDIFMPKRGGFETIMALHGSIPVIAMSGVSSHRFEPLEFAQSIGAERTLSKPFLPDTLLEIINELLKPEKT
ncbi:Two-component response regulator (fragment) [Candidatus Terasakiella magnetica]|uniref:Two-component response regulator n=1 Tax=Candidatus Terasakiella magnetica TaxID=1867952 RepID=A0A1C3REX4_9PROT